MDGVVRIEEEQGSKETIHKDQRFEREGEGAEEWREVENMRKYEKTNVKKMPRQDRQTNCEIDRQLDQQKGRQIDTQIHSERDNLMDIHTGRQIEDK